MSLFSSQGQITNKQIDASIETNKVIANLYDIRMAMSEPLNLANKLPHPDQLRRLPEVSEDLVKAQNDLIESLTTLSEDFLKLAAPFTTEHSSPEELWAVSKPEIDSLIASLDESADTLQLSSVNTSLTDQIARALEDMDHLMNKEFTNRSYPDILGLPEGAVALGKVSCYTLDENDFFENMLKDLLQSVHAPHLDALKMTNLQKDLQVKKRSMKSLAKKKVNNGRKISFETHDKLFGFMAPKSRTPEGRELLEALRSGIFK